MNRTTAIEAWREVCGSDTVMASFPPTGRMLEEFARRIEKQTMDTYTPTEQQLRKEVEALRRDAERWRIASRSHNFGIIFYSEFGMGTCFGEVAEQRIDAELAKTK